MQNNDTNTTLPIQGRSIFIVETTASGIAVHTSFLAEDNTLIQAPAVFPDVGYALAQIDEMRNMVLRHFTQAAQVGAQVIAAEAAKNSIQKNKIESETNSEEENQ